MFNSQWPVSLVPLVHGFRAKVSILSLAFFACAVISAQQNPAAPAATPVATGAEQSVKNVSDNTDNQVNAPASSGQAEKVAASDGSSITPVQSASDASPEAAAKDAAQNPVAATISIPFQNNTFSNFGGYKRNVNALEIEPVIPFRLSNDWILITRTITPLIYMPRVSPLESDHFGLGNLNPQFYLSPAHPGKVIWGVGPQFWLPTATDRTLGVNKWGAGPAVVVLTKRGHWLFGSLVNNIWTGGAGRQGHQDPNYPTVFHSLNQMTLNPFVYYNMKGGWYFVSSPIMTADWAANPDNRWTVPVGGGVGRVFKIGTQMLNARTQFLRDVKQVEGGQSWTMQMQVQFLFPHKRSQE